MAHYPNKGLRGPPMSLITVNLTKHFKDILDSFVSKGIVPSRSAAVRLALSYGLPYLQQMFKDQEVLIKSSLIAKESTRTPANVIFVERPNKTFQKYQVVA